MTTILSSIIWDVSPTIFTLNIGDIQVPLVWYGLLFACGFVIGYWVVSYIFRQEGQPRTDVDSLTIYVIAGTVLGARVGHFVFYEWELLLTHPWKWLLTLVTPPFLGLASHGATIAILVSLYLYSRTRAQQSFLWVTDRVVIPACIGGAMIRLGNLMNSEIYGVPTQLPWGFAFVRETDPALLPVVPRHPTQLYEAGFCLLLLVLTFSLWKYRRHLLPEGFITGIFLILLFSFRFLIEFLKNNQVAFEDGLPFNMGQILSIPAILVGIVILLVAKRKATTKAFSIP